MRNAFVFDVNRCTGCQACQLACTIENGLQPDRSWRAINTFNEPRYPGIPLFHLSLACNHCAEPACMAACPALAYSVDSSTGAVLIDAEACIGCGYCAWACPYDAPRYDNDLGIMTKCTFCNHRLAEGLTPACAALCPTGALSVNRLPEEDLSQQIEGFPSSDLRPALKVIPRRRSLGAAAAVMETPAGHWAPPDHMTPADHTAPSVDTTPADQATPSAHTMPAFEPTMGGHRVESKISLKKEWPLAVFTWLACVMFALLVLFAAARGAVPGMPEPAGHPLVRSAVVAQWPAAMVFAAIGAVAMLLGGAHLGRKARAWRIVLNVARSPLSREIVAFGLFAGFGTGYLLLAEITAPLTVVALASGMLALSAIEDVYRYTLRATGPLPHSANVLLTGPLLAALLLPGSTAANALVVALGVVKALLYAWRKLSLARRGITWRPLVTVSRLGIGAVAPIVIAVLSGPREALVACVLVGELIDRCELYDELEIMTPRLQTAREVDKLRGAATHGMFAAGRGRSEGLG